MGRSLKKRKLKSVHRMKVQRFSEPVRQKKKIMKRWEWWLLGVTFVAAIGIIIYLAKTGSIIAPNPSTGTATATAAPAK